MRRGLLSTAAPTGRAPGPDPPASDVNGNGVCPPVAAALSCRWYVEVGSCWGRGLATGCPGANADARCGLLGAVGGGAAQVAADLWFAGVLEDDLDVPVDGAVRHGDVGAQRIAAPPLVLHRFDPVFLGDVLLDVVLRGDVSVDRIGDSRQADDEGPAPANTSRTASFVRSGPAKRASSSSKWAW